MRFRRLPVDDVYTEDGISVVMAGTQVVVLSPIASALLALLEDRELDVDEAAERLVAQFGPPPDDATGRAAVQTTLTDLAGLGLVIPSN